MPLIARGATWASLGRREWGLSRNPGVDHQAVGLCSGTRLNIDIRCSVQASQWHFDLSRAISELMVSFTDPGCPASLDHEALANLGEGGGTWIYHDSLTLRFLEVVVGTHISCNIVLSRKFEVENQSLWEPQWLDDVPGDNDLFYAMGSSKDVVLYPNQNAFGTSWYGNGSRAIFVGDEHDEQP